MSSALLITSAQVDLLHPKGIAWGMVRESVEQNHVPQKLQRLLEAARRAHVPVIHSPVGFDYAAMTSFEPNNAIQKVIVNHHLLAQGEVGAEFINEAKPINGEIVLPPRQGFSSFWTRMIQPHLERLNVRTLFLAGMLAEACIESHTRDGVENGYRPVVVQDAIGATSLDLLSASSRTLSLHAFALTSANEAIADWST